MTDSILRCYDTAHHTVAVTTLKVTLNEVFVYSDDGQTATQALNQSVQL